MSDAEPSLAGPWREASPSISVRSESGDCVRRGMHTADRHRQPRSRQPRSCQRARGHVSGLRVATSAIRSGSCVRRSSVVQLRRQPSSQRVEGAVPDAEVATTRTHVILGLEADLGPRAETGPQLQLDRNPSPQPRATQSPMQPPRAARFKARCFEHELPAHTDARVVGPSTPPVRKIGKQRRVQSGHSSERRGSPIARVHWRSEIPGDQPGRSSANRCCACEGCAPPLWADREQVAHAPVTGNRCRRHRHTVLVHRERLEDIVVTRLVQGTVRLALTHPVGIEFDGPRSGNVHPSNPSRDNEL
ncbi:MAG: hypothetical protein JWL83_1798 [Actinomycetia bacterium]|nr:hypothetical protein [Actinomycetes bacterium]